jgi:hypothetical protein
MTTDTAAAVLNRHQPKEFRPTSTDRKIDSPRPGVVILARDVAGETRRLVCALYANNDAGAVATALLEQRARSGPGHFVYIKDVDNLGEGLEIQSEFSAVCSEPNYGLAKEQNAE